MVYQRETLRWIIDDLAYLASHSYSSRGCLILRQFNRTKGAQSSEHYFLNETLQRSLIHPLVASLRCPMPILMVAIHRASVYL